MPPFRRARLRSARLYLRRSPLEDPFGGAAIAKSADLARFILSSPGYRPNRWNTCRRPDSCSSYNVQATFLDQAIGADNHFRQLADGSIYLATPQRIPASPDFDLSDCEGESKGLLAKHFPHVYGIMKSRRKAMHAVLQDHRRSPVAFLVPVLVLKMEGGREWRIRWSCKAQLASSSSVC
ncbi:hypothetical protein LY76DRAFT_601917 [Colletotrichum caudatum]|nr:hypothetical protein LY76DRAFT_601917 [Colletotrichum caudatum]